MKFFKVWQLLCCFFALPFWSQSDLSLQQQASQAITAYFQLDRETIHLHFNKGIYPTSETVWFKGYIIEKKFQPTFPTTNVYLSLINSQGERVANQLLFAENNVFEGHLELAEDLPSGTYYVQAYTNFMNNFSEDESSIYTLKIVNTKDKSAGIRQKPNAAQVDVAFYPESGTFLQKTSNTVVVKVADCAGNGFAIKDAEIVDTNGNTISTLSTDAFGYGRFEIYDTAAEQYRMLYTIDGKKNEKNLPMPVATGFNVSVNSYFFPDKTTIKIRTNQTTLSGLRDKPSSLVFQHNDLVTFLPVDLNGATELTVAVPNSELSLGINVIYLVNDKLEKLTERVFYNPVTLSGKTLVNVANKTGQYFTLSGSTPVRSGSLSISVLPASTLNVAPDKPIHGSFLIDNYLDKPVDNLGYYLTDVSKKKHFELDQVLVTQKPKYDWHKMLGTPPQKKFDTDFGLQIKGTVTDGNTKNIYKINMNSPALGFNEFTSPDVQNEFLFKNLMAIDSAKIFFLPKDNKGKLLSNRIVCQIAGNNHRLIKPFVPPANQCSTAPIYESLAPLPKIENSIILDSVTVESKKKVLKYKNRMGNLTARGYKITEADANKSLLSFIGNNGYTVSRVGGDVAITSTLMAAAVATGQFVNVGRNRTTTTTVLQSRTPNANGPAIFVDDQYIPRYDQLIDFSMAKVDEIYINKSSNDLSVYGSRGIIKVYTKTKMGMATPSNTPVMIVKNGFQRYTPYKNPKYDSVREEGFLKLGSVHWKPMVETDENGTFVLAIPNLYQKSVRVIIEGLSANGEMVSESLLLNLE